MEKQLNSGGITDVTLFFREMISEYVDLEQNILKVISRVHSCTPEQLLNHCHDLLKEREKMARLDRQLFDILDLAEKEIGEDHMVHTCYKACKRANAACSELYQRLLYLKTTLH
jgi:hypothetical protein